MTATCQRCGKQVQVNKDEGLRLHLCRSSYSRGQRKAVKA